MGVFAADIQTPLAVPDPGSDYKLPPPGALSYAQITQPTALAGTTGVDALLVAGDRDRQMNGNESTRVTQNRSHTVGGDQTKQIAGNKNENVTGNFGQATIGNLNRSIIGATTDLHTGTHAISHKADQHVDEPQKHFHNVVTKFFIANEHHDQFTTYQLVAGNVVNLIGMNNDFKGVQTAVIGAAAEKALASYADHLAHIADKALDARFTAVHNRVGAIQPVVHVAYFHEVAITQKIIVVGVNQFM